MKRFKFRFARRLLWLLSHLPLSAAQQAGGSLGRVAWLLAGRSRKTTEVNIALCFPELAPEKRERLAKASLMETGKTIMEIPLIWERPVAECLAMIREIEGQELLDEALNSGKGLLLLAPHLGNWELAGLYFASRHRMAALYSPPHLPEFENYMVQVRGRSGSELVRGDRRGLARLISLLREGGIAGILPDQSPRGPGATYAPFFGIEARTMTLAAKLLRKSGAQALITYTERLPNAEGFRLVIRRCGPDIGAGDARLAATALNQAIEACVRSTPEQYQWEYKRFRHRPPGETTHYQD